MGKTAWAFSGFLFLLILQRAQAQQGTGTVSGIILESATNRPLPGVRVTLNTAPAAPALLQTAIPKTVTTNVDGRFTIPGVEPGRYRVTPESDGYVFARPARLSLPRDIGVWVQVAGAAATSDIEMKMQREAIISGRVLDANGKAVPGNAASVTLVRRTYDETGDRTLTWVPGIHYPNAAGSFLRMNDQGDFRFYGLPPGDYYLRVSGGPSGGNPPRLPVNVYYPGTIDEAKAKAIHIEAGQEVRLNTMTFQTVLASNLRLKFVDPPGEPPIGRNIQIGSRFVGGFGPAAPEMTLPVAPGHYDILVNTASAAGQASIDVGAVDMEQQITLTAGFQVTMKFFMEDPEGKRSPFVPGLALSCGLQSQTIRLNRTCVTLKGITYVGNALSGFNSSQATPTVPADTYRLELSKLPSDVFALAAMVSGKDVLHVPISVDRETEIEIVLSSGAGLVSGTVKNEKGESMPDAVVVLIPEEPLRGDRYLYRSVVADVNGSFQIRDIAPGDYRVLAWQELDGAAYLNAEFMKPYSDRGERISVKKGSRVTVGVTAFLPKGN